MRWTDRTVVMVALALTGCGHSADAAQATIPHPDKNDARIEYFARHPAGTGPWPTVIFLHGHQNPMSRIGGRAFANWGVLDRFAKDGYLAVSVSLRGYGGSSGPEDFAGPFTQHAVNAVIAKLEADRQAIPKKGLDPGRKPRGGNWCARGGPRSGNRWSSLSFRPLRPSPVLRTSKSAGAIGVKAVAIKQTGGNAEALRSRSALPLASNIHASTFILNGAKDDRTDAAQARRFAAAIKAHGGRAKIHIYPEFGHEIPVKARDAEVNTFIDATLRH